MPVHLEGSCRCGTVTFAVDSHTPYPYQLCYCTVCRKTGGGGGYAINLMGDAGSLVVHGRTAAWHALIDGERSPAERHACPRCASALWLFDPRWPELVHPLASAIDTPLPVPPSRVHLMLADAPAWVRPAFGPGDGRFDGLPEQSIEEWHRSRGLWVD